MLFVLRWDELSTAVCGTPHVDVQVYCFRCDRVAFDFMVWLLCLTSYSKMQRGITLKKIRYELKVFGVPSIQCRTKNAFNF